MMLINGLTRSCILTDRARRFCTSSSTSRFYDILVCGGGVVGSAFVSSLLHKLRDNKSLDSASLSIAIVDFSHSEPNISASPTPQLRVYALSPTSIETLKRMDAWSLIEPRSQPYRSMQVWEGTGLGVVNFAAKDLKIADGLLGRICEDATINASIYHSLEPFSGQVDILRQTSLLALHSPRNSSSKGDVTDNFLVATVKNNATGAVETIKARLVVGADGNNSAVRKLSNIATWGFEYGQEALVATVKVTVPVSEQSRGDGNSTAWQKYLPTGPLALLPLWGGYSSVVWSTSVAEARRLQALPNEQLAAEIDTALRDNPTFRPHHHRCDFPDRSSVSSRAMEELSHLADGLMAAALVSQPFRTPPAVTAVEGKAVCFPLSFQHARRYLAATGRVTLIGDAAHTIHPQAGQGLNLGLLDAEALSDAVVASMSVGEDIGSLRSLTQYESERFWKNLSMMTTVDAINSIFKIGSDSKLSQRFNVLRTFGMLGVNAMTPIKEFIANFAIGKSK